VASRGEDMDLPLSIALSDNARTRPILEGKVKAEGIACTCTNMHPSELFWRQLRFAEFDVSEMSLSGLMMAVAGGDDRWIGIPVFTTRKMFQVGVLVRRDRGIAVPADLKGKKMGVPEYQQTAALWTRGYLQHEYDVHPRDMEFWMERNEDKSQGAAIGFRPPKDVKLNYIPNSTNLGEMLLDGKLDGALRYLANTNNAVDRSSLDLYRHPDFKTLFPDPHAEGVKFYNKTGIYPINHGMVIKRAIAEKHPWTVPHIFKAFEKALALAEKARKEAVEYHLETGLLPPDARKALATPLVQYGVEPNRKVLETAAQWSFEQGLTPRLVKMDELFPRTTMQQ
jgi:4,5-dihydroxyphthalate decarboxylase